MSRFQRILIVDDSATARMLVRRCLEIAGLGEAEFIEAIHGADALAKITQSPVDLVITDLIMPEMGGDTLLRHLRARPRTHDVPVIVITSAGNEARNKQLSEMGATTVLPKPISPPVITETLEELFGEES